MTDQCSKEEVKYCIKQSLLVFMFQILLVICYASQYSDFNQYEQIRPAHTSMRFSISILLHIALKNDFLSALSMFTYLKR